MQLQFIGCCQWWWWWWEGFSCQDGRPEVLLNEHIGQIRRHFWLLGGEDETLAAC